MTYSTTPALLKTVAAIATATGSTSATKTSNQTAPIATFTGAASELFAVNGAVLAGALGVAAFLA